MVVSQYHSFLEEIFFLLVLLSFSSCTYFSLNKTTWPRGHLNRFKRRTSLCMLSMKTFSTGVNKCGGKCLFWSPTVPVFKFTYLGGRWKELAIEL